MKNAKMKALACFIIIFVVLSSLAGCSKKSKNSIKSFEDSYSLADKVSSGMLSENDTYRLIWNANKLCVLLENKYTGKIWGTTASDVYESDDATEYDVKTMMMLDYIFVPGKKNEITSAASCMDITSKQIENGIEITFWFEELKIGVPIRFILTEDGIKIEAILNSIVEGAKYKVFRIGFAPYLCSVVNSPDNYLFVPSGSGALMYTDERGENSKRLFTGAVYGEDPQYYVETKYSNDEQIRMGIFGAVSGEDAICGVIGSGCENARISAVAGDSEKGHSNIYVWFQLRGINYLDTGSSQANYYTNDMIGLDSVNVQYIPLHGEKAGYNGFAELYRQYLNEKKRDSERLDHSIVSLEFIGAAQLKNFIFGFPYNSLDTLTTFDDVESIIKDVTKENSVSVNVLLTGFGTTGIDISKIAGGLKFAKALGDYSSLNDYCGNNEIPLYVDYNVLQFSKNGVSVKRNDSVKNVNQMNSKQYSYSAATGAVNKDDVHYLLRRSEVARIVDKVSERSQKINSSAVCLSSLGSIAYSDYRSNKYYVKNNMSKFVTNELSNLYDDGIVVSTVMANDYAALCSDFSFNSPTYSTQNIGFDVDIPFYQMVLKGITNLSVNSINTSSCPKQQYLKAIESGCSLKFTLINDYDSVLSASVEKSVAQSIYSGVKTSMNEMISEAKGFLESVNTATISGHYILNDSLRKTVYSNGIVVYVNFGNEMQTADGITVDSLNFKVVG